MMGHRRHPRVEGTGGSSPFGPVPDQTDYGAPPYVGNRNLALPYERYLRTQDTMSDFRRFDGV